MSTKFSKREADDMQKLCAAIIDSLEECPDHNTAMAALLTVAAQISVNTMRSDFDKVKVTSMLTNLLPLLIDQFWRDRGRTVLHA